MINILSWVTDTLVMYGLPKCLLQPQNQLQINSFCGSLHMASQMLFDQMGAHNFVKLLCYFVKIIRLNMNLLLLTTLSPMALPKQQSSLSSFCLKERQNPTKISMLHYQLSDKCHVLMATAPAEMFFKCKLQGFLSQIRHPSSHNSAHATMTREITRAKNREKSATSGDIPPFAAANKVLIQNHATKQWDISGQILSERPSGSYNVLFDNGECHIRAQCSLRHNLPNVHIERRGRGCPRKVPLQQEMSDQTDKHSCSSPQHKQQSPRMLQKRVKFDF